MKYDDLLNIPYKRNGRELDGLDCYGLVLECCRRVNHPLNDIIKEPRLTEEELTKYRASFNVIEIDHPVQHGVVQCVYDDFLHIGFILDKKTCIHATKNGVRVSPLAALKSKKYYEVIR